MKARRAQLAVGFAMLTLAACGDHSDPVQVGAPSFAAGGIGRPAGVVNPKSGDNGTAKTIQQGIDMGADGGKVKGVPGIYREASLNDKGRTLEAGGGGERPRGVA